MRIKFTVISVFVVVIVGSLAGMVLGGLFGYAAGNIAPKLFEKMILWADLDAIGTATVLGAIAGVLLGGGLAVFAIIIQFLGQWFAQKNATNTNISSSD